jgi:undecaprenyl-diphosphatase
MNWIANIENWDHKLIILVNNFNNPILDQMMWAVSSPLFGIPFYIIFIFFISRNYNLKHTVAIVVMLAAVIGVGDFVAHELFKETIQRFRPSHNLEINYKLHFHLNDDGSFYTGGQYGFVSNHATNMAALCWGVFLVLKKRYKSFWVYLLLFVLLISFSRMYLGVHYLTDLIGGWIIGIILAQIGFIMTKKYIKL